MRDYGHCGKPFKRNGRQVYCTQHCREVAQRLRSRRMGGVRYIGKNDLNGELFARFLDAFTQIHKGERGAPRHSVNQRLVSKHDARTVYAWRREGRNPSLWRADRFLIDYGLHINDFFFWCKERGESPWARGKPPEWHEKEFKAPEWWWELPEAA